MNPLEAEFFLHLVAEEKSERFLLGFTTVAEFEHEGGHVIMT